MEKVYTATPLCCASTWQGQCGGGFLTKALTLTTLVWAACSVASGVAPEITDSFHLTEISPTVVQHSSSVTSGQAFHVSDADVVEATEYLSRNGWPGGLHVTLTAQVASASGVQVSSEPLRFADNSDGFLSTSDTGSETNIPLTLSQISDLTPVIEDGVSSAPPQLLATTDYLDSVAVSVRHNPNEVVSEISPTSSFAQPVVVSVQGSAGNISLADSTGLGNESTLVNTNSTNTVDFGIATPTLHLPNSVSTVSTVSENRTAAPSSEFIDHVQDSVIAVGVTAGPVTDMVETNATFHPTFTESISPSSAHESTVASILSIPVSPDLSSHSPSPGNESCAQDDAGCVEYHGDSSDKDLQMTIIIGVVCGVVALLVVMGVVIGCMCRRRGKMSSGSKVNLSSYWDDSVTLSYINGHIDIPKDSADEMISLDNDSFLNSLDSMSFTNTWTSDSSKHTIF